MENSNICKHCKQQGHFLGICINCGGKVCEKCGTTQRVLGFLFRKVRHRDEWCLNSQSFDGSGIEGDLQ
jgi:hypothetical protein